MDPELYALDEAVARLEASPESGPDRLAALAWHLRQRDTRRARALADEAVRLLPERSSGPARRLIARLTLVQAEAACLFGELARAETLLQEAASGFAAVDDRLGLGDTHIVEGLLALSLGQSERELVAYQAAHAAYAGDSRRTAVAASFVASAATWLDIERAAEFRPALLAAAADPHPAISGIALLTLNRSEIARSDLGSAIEHGIAAFERTGRVGLVRLSILAASTVGAAFANLEDYDGAALWYERALDIARPTGWPMAIGVALTQLGKLCEILGQAETASGLLDEACTWLAPFPASRNMAIALRYRGDIALVLGHDEAALAAFRALEELSRTLRHGDLGISALRGQAQALGRQGRFDEAHRAALAAIAASEAAGEQGKLIDALLAMSEIQERHHQPPPDMAAPHAVIHYLERALASGASVPGWQERSELLVPLGRAWEQAGDLRRALDCERRARAALLRDSAERTARRLLGLQFRHETERARAEAEHLRQQAAASAETSRTLDELGRIGQRITATLDSDKVFDAVAGHVAALIDAQILSVFMLDPAGTLLAEAFGTGPAHEARAAVIALDDPHAMVARAARERLELVDAPAPASDSLVPAATPIRSALHAPLVAGERLLGVLSVGSAREHAYGERERLIFRTLCAYAAIALDNARAYRNLDRANAELERLANADPLTGLANRRRFFEAATQELARARRYGHGCAVVMIDLDHFKRVNDTYGHAAGDATLRTAADCLTHCLRESDLGARFGGEELVALLPVTELDGAARFAERFRARLQAAETHHEAHTIRVTASIGVSVWTRSEASIGPAVDRADQALYRVKHAGRNAVGIEPPVEAG